MNFTRSTLLTLVAIGAHPFAVGCALSAEAVETVLSDTEALDQACTTAVEAFRAAPGDEAAALHAARILFQNADLRVQRALVEALRSLGNTSLDAVIEAEQELPSSIQSGVLSLATTGAEAAQAALDVRSSADGHLHLALHLTFIAWANGAVRSLFAGYGPRITRAIDAAVAADPLWDNAGPLRLQGRFLTRAPWPYGDLDLAQTALERALAHAPLPIHHLFLGDLLFAKGDTDGAVAQWEQVRTATADASTTAAAQAHRDLAELRLAAARSGQLP